MVERKSPAPLSSRERAEALKSMVDWRYDMNRRAFHRAWQFRDFAEAIGFMMRVAVEAEKADHHPEWTNVYNKLDIWLTTHDAGDVSARDLHLAGMIDRFHPVLS